MGNTLSQKIENEITSYTSELYTKVTDLLDSDYYGYPVVNFSLMPPGTDRKLIMEAMNLIILENKKNGVSTSFSGAPSNCVGLPYMELLFPDGNTGNYYVYSVTNGSGNLFTTDANNLVIKNPGIITNSYRFYMWNTTIFDLAIEPTNEFPKEKYIPYNDSKKSIVQKMEMKATTVPNKNGAYTPSTVVRNTIYVYYPSSILYCLVDTQTGDIYVMQAGNNQNTGTTPLTPENMIYTQQLIADTIPDNMVFLSCQLINSQTVLVVSSPNNPATLMEDSLGNSYQLADKYFAKSLYENLTPAVKKSS